MGPRFATWNVLAQMFIEQKWYPGHDEKQWEYKTRLDRIVESIHALYPLDVIFFQEMTIEMRDELVKRLPNYTFGKLALHDQRNWEEHIKSREYGNVTAVANWFGEFLTQTANYWHESGTAYDTSVIVSFDRRDAYFTVNVHLDDGSANLRIEEADAVLKHTFGIDNLVVAGDMNTNDWVFHNRFVKFGLESAVPSDKAVSTFLDEDVMIDYIYTRGLRTTKAEVVSPKIAWQYGSDHNLVLAELQ